jgi:hypothetical protein
LVPGEAPATSVEPPRTAVVRIQKFPAKFSLITLKLTAMTGTVSGQGTDHSDHTYDEHGRVASRYPQE